MFNYGRKRWKRHLRYVTASCPVCASVISLTQMVAFFRYLDSANIYFQTRIASVKLKNVKLQKLIGHRCQISAVYRCIKGNGAGQNGGGINTFAYCKWRSYRERLHNRRDVVYQHFLSALGTIVQNVRDRTAVHGNIGKRPRRRRRRPERSW